MSVHLLYMHVILSGVESVRAREIYPFETSHCYAQIDECHREQQDFGSLSLIEMTVLILS